MKSPLISVIIPCYNEEATIDGVLNAIHQQTLPMSDLEVVIADGRSTDRTREKITEFQKTHPELTIKLVDNIKRIIPAALNLALDNSEGEFIVRMDGHTLPAADYLEKCVLALRAGKGENVGGVLEVKSGSDTWIARSIAGCRSPAGCRRCPIPARHHCHRSGYCSFWIFPAFIS